MESIAWTYGNAIVASYFAIEGSRHAAMHIRSHNGLITRLLMATAYYALAFVGFTLSIARAPWL